jgi:hypothetical protein
MAKGRKTGGRQRGVPNKATAKRQEEIASSGLTPLEFMLMALRDESKDFLTRFEAAKAAAPYVHPKLSSVEASGKNGGPIETVTTIELVAGDKDDEGTD